MPWQLAAVEVQYEYDPVTGLFRYRSDDTTVPRQSGKTTVTLARKVHRMTVMARRHGPQRATYTAQTRLAARRKLERDFAIALRASKSFRELTSVRGRPTKATEWKLSTNNGSENIQFGLGNFFQIDAPTDEAGHGDTLDMGTIDEAFSHEDDAVEGAMRPAMSTRRNAQLSTLSTAGTEKSKFFYRRVLAGRAAAELGHHGGTCYTEYSAPDDADPADPVTWWACMPALGNTVGEDFIQAEWDSAVRTGPDAIKLFRRAYLNQWVDPPMLVELVEGGIFAADLWAALKRKVGTPVRPALGVEITPGRSRAIIYAAWVAGSRKHIEPVEENLPVDQILLRLIELKARYGATTVAVDTGAEAGTLAAPRPDSDKSELELAGLTLVKVTGAKRYAACAALHDAADKGQLSHDGDPALAGAVGLARWVSGAEGARVFSRTKSAGDITELWAATLALYALDNQPVDVSSQVF